MIEILPRGHITSTMLPSTLTALTGDTKSGTGRPKLMRFGGRITAFICIRLNSDALVHCKAMLLLGLVLAPGPNIRLCWLTSFTGRFGHREAIVFRVAFRPSPRLAKLSCQGRPRLGFAHRCCWEGCVRVVRRVRRLVARCPCLCHFGKSLLPVASATSLVAPRFVPGRRRPSNAQLQIHPSRSVAPPSWPRL